MLRQPLQVKRQLPWTHVTTAARADKHTQSNDECTYSDCCNTCMCLSKHASTGSHSSRHTSYTHQPLEGCLHAASKGTRNTVNSRSHLVAWIRPCREKFFTKQRLSDDLLAKSDACSYWQSSTGDAIPIPLRTTAGCSLFIATSTSVACSTNAVNHL